MLIRRGMGWAGEGASQAGCPSGQWNASLQTCCAPGDGTVAAMDDPCSIFNQPGYLSEQTTVQQQAESGDAGNFSSELTALNNYTQPQQQAALDCVSNPGLVYTDAWGNRVTCPAAEVNDNGIMVSAYTAEQIAAMIAGQFNVSSEPANAFAGTTVAPPVGTTVPAAAIQAAAPKPGTTTTGSSGSTGSTGSGGSGGTSNSSSTSGLDLSFLTDSTIISGMANWEVIALGFGAVLLLPSIIAAMGRR